MKRSEVIKAGEDLIAARRFEVAERLYVKAIKQSPKDVRLYSALASLLTRYMSRAKEAEKIVLRGLQLSPRNSDLLRDAAEICFRTKRKQDAIRYARESLMSGGSKNPDTLYVAATIFEKMEEFEEAAAAMEKALAIRPDHLPSRLLYAEAIRALGRLDDASEICRELLSQHPNSLQIIAIYSQTRKITADDPHFKNLEDHIIPVLREKKNAGQLALALKCMGKAKLDTGEHVEAFKYFMEGKAVANVPHNRGKQKKYVAQIKRMISVADYFGKSTSDEDRPVLIVGMPRVGSTLLEQIIASHPDTAAVGESGAMRARLPLVGMQEPDGLLMAKAIKSIDENTLNELRKHYLAETVEKRPGALRVVDKNLHNFELLGLFARMFPRARIIHALRDPMDNCVSCYLQRLSAWHSYTTDLAALGQYYKEHLELMRHWKSVLPNPIMEVPYEETVADTEGMARKVIDFLGLEWNESVLDFQKTSNRAKTASVWQVRQPIYKSSVKRWKRYDEFLDPLKKELAPLYPNGFDEDAVRP